MANDAVLEIDNQVVVEEDLIASICRERFYDFLVEFWDVLIDEPMVPNWHIEYLCDQLQETAHRVHRGDDKEDLVINVPPGSSKSTICSQAFPAWVWTWFPAARFLCASYAHPIALKDSLKTRDIVQSEKYRRCFPDVIIRDDENTKGLFTNTKKGFRLSVGTGGLATGFHGHFLLVDDPINPEESFSEAELKATNRWLRQTFLSRKVNKRVNPLILIQQRLHQADPSGEMLERAKGRVKHICIPGELTDGVSPPELREKYVDGLFDPVRLPRKTLEEMKDDLGAYGYAGQVLQDPAPAGGGTFEVDKLIRWKGEPPVMLQTVRAWDKAGTKDGGAYSVGVLIGRDKYHKYWILDVVRGQWSNAVREDKMLATAETDDDGIEILIEIEGGSGGKESGENSAGNLAGYRVRLIHVTGDKEQRAYPFSSQVGAGNVYVLERPWTEKYIEELKYFPNSKYKDQVDASSLGFNRIHKKRRKVGGWK